MRHSCFSVWFYLFLTCHFLCPTDFFDTLYIWNYFLSVTTLHLPAAGNLNSAETFVWEYAPEQKHSGERLLNIKQQNILFFLDAECRRSPAIIHVFEVKHRFIKKYMKIEKLPFNLSCILKERKNRRKEETRNLFVS